MDGILLINKEKGWTSRDVCNRCQNIFDTKKIGHTGTLDPFATGLLVITVNKANKICQFLDDYKKTYVATLKLGSKTQTGDNTSEIIASKDFKTYTKEEIISVLESFVGDIFQVPPMTSAIHHEGRKLYELYYEGVEVEREKRKVTVYDINLISYENDEIVFSCSVSKGTYIRTLGEDIALKLDTYGHLTNLFRTNIGPYDVKDAKKISEVKRDENLLSTYSALSFMSSYCLEDDMVKKVKDGHWLTLPEYKDELIFVHTKDLTPIAIYERAKENKYKCRRGLW